jgi:hypothetical protein
VGKLPIGALSIGQRRASDSHELIIERVDRKSKSRRVKQPSKAHRPRAPKRKMHRQR